MTKTEWEKTATNTVKAEMARRGVDYEHLRIALANIGIINTTPNIVKTVNLGKFSFAFFLQIMQALEVKIRYE